MRGAQPQKIQEKYRQNTHGLELKNKNIGLEGGGGLCPLSPLLDPPLEVASHCQLSYLVLLSEQIFLSDECGTPFYWHVYELGLSVCLFLTYNLSLGAEDMLN